MRGTLLQVTTRTPKRHRTALEPACSSQYSLIFVANSSTALEPSRSYSLTDRTGPHRQALRARSASRDPPCPRPTTAGSSHCPPRPAGIVRGQGAKSAKGRCQPRGFLRTSGDALPGRPSQGRRARRRGPPAGTPVADPAVVPPAQPDSPLRDLRSWQGDSGIRRDG